MLLLVPDALSELQHIYTTCMDVFDTAHVQPVEVRANMKGIDTISKHTI